MQVRIRMSLIYVGVLATIFAVYFSVQVFEETMEEQLQNFLRQNAHLIEAAYNQTPTKELKKFTTDSLRITLISKEGNVLFESDRESSKMENHLRRPEVISAFETGSGKGMRHSVTLDANIYYYALKLSEKLDDAEILDDDCLYKEIAPFVKTIRNKNRELAITIEKLHDEEQKTARLKDEFTANAAHELKTPLTTISGYAEMLETGIAKPEDTVRFAGKIHSEAKRMLSITNDIMTLSKLDKPGERSINLNEDVELWTVANNCVGVLSLNANKKNITLFLQGTGDSQIKGNENLIFEMIYNLVDNAIRYTNENGKVVVTVAKTSITVMDNGIGIPEECKNRVFERFFRVDKSHSRETGGTGLGLAIVKHVAEVHHAKIEMKSIVGVGTEIKVEF